jgi:hypothetical protein
MKPKKPSVENTVRHGTLNQQFVKPQINAAHTTFICGFNVCALIHASSIISVKSEITIEGGSRPKNIVFSREFLYGVLISTNHQHVSFVWTGGFLNSFTQPQLIGGMSPSEEKFKDACIPAWIEFKASRLIPDQKIASWCS